jgi:hypothetical protein
MPRSEVSLTPGPSPTNGGDFAYRGPRAGAANHPLMYAVNYLYHLWVGNATRAFQDAVGIEGEI